MFPTFNKSEDDHMDIDEEGTGNQSDEEMDEGARSEKLQEKEERRRYRPYKFSGKSYSFDL